jgi:exonuclease III
MTNNERTKRANTRRVRTQGERERARAAYIASYHERMQRLQAERRKLISEGDWERIRKIREEEL